MHVVLVEPNQISLLTGSPPIVDRLATNINDLIPRNLCLEPNGQLVNAAIHLIQGNKGERVKPRELTRQIRPSKSKPARGLP